MRVAILDDYFNAALEVGDWSLIEGKAEITVFNEPFADENAAASALRDFEAIVGMRERTPFPASLIERLANLKLLITTGMRNYSFDMEAGKPGLGFKHAMMTLDCARPGVAAQAVGLAQGALDFALAYATKRQQFGKSISSFQLVQKMLADMATKVEAARTLVYAAARAVDEGSPRLTKYSAMCKLFATDVAMEVTTDAVQLFGGYGYMRDYPIEKYMRDAKITQIYEGTNQVQRIVVARALMQEAADLATLLDRYIPREVQRGVNDGTEDAPSPNMDA